MVCLSDFYGLIFVHMILCARFQIVSADNLPEEIFATVKIDRYKTKLFFICIRCESVELACLYSLGGIT